MVVIDSIHTSKISAGVAVELDQGSSKESPQRVAAQIPLPGTKKPLAEAPVVSMVADDTKKIGNTPAKMSAVQKGIGRIIGKNSLFYSYAESLRKQNEQLKHALRMRNTDVTLDESVHPVGEGVDESHDNVQVVDDDESMGQRERSRLMTAAAIANTKPTPMNESEENDDCNEQTTRQAADPNAVGRGEENMEARAKDNDQDQRVADDELLADWMRELRRAIALEKARCSKATELNSSPRRRNRNGLVNDDANETLGLGQLELGKQGQKVPPRVLLERQWQRVFEEVGVNVNTIDEIVDRYLDDSMAVADGDEDCSGFDWEAADAILGDGAPRSVVEARLLAASARKAIAEFKKRDTLLRSAYRDAVARAQKFAASQRHRSVWNSNLLLHFFPLMGRNSTHFSIFFQINLTSGAAPRLA